MKRKTKYTILFAIAIVLLTISCKKNDTGSVVTPQPKLKSVTMLPSGTIISYFYDSLGRISKISTTGASNYNSYVYKGIDSIIVYSSNGTDSSRTDAYKLNGIGLVVADITPTASATYTYDINGYLTYINTSSTLGNAKDTFIISGNNISEHRSGGTSIFNTFNLRQAYTSLSGKSNTVSNETRGMSFFGKSIANPVSAETYHSVTSVSFPVPGTTTSDDSFTYVYEYDTRGWITKMTKTAVTSSTVTTETYTYY